jgi:hypothetical protein
MDFLCFFIAILYLASVVLADFSPIAPVVIKIHQLLPKEKQRVNTVKFLIDPEIWNKYLRDVAITDFDRAKEILDAVGDILYVEEMEDPKFSSDNLTNLLLKNREGNKYVDANFTKKNIDKFNMKTAIEHLAEGIIAYDKVMSDDDVKKRFKEGKPLGDLAEALSLTLTKLNPNNWDKEFYAKLTKAAKNEKDEDGTKTVKSEKSEKSEKYDEGWGKNLLWILLAIVVGLIIIGVVIFFILRRRKQA